MRRSLLVGLFACAALVASAADAQQFTPQVRQPSFPSGAGPRVVIDAGHFNEDRADLGPLVELLNRDGFRVSFHESTWTATALAQADLVVIAAPLAAARANMQSAGYAWSDQSRRDAFTAEEVVAITSWIRAGGNLLLLLDEAPVPAATRTLAEALGVEVRNTRTWDAGQRPAGYAYAPDDLSGSYIMFTRERKTIGKHPIVDGRNRDEKVDRVATYIGSSLVGPFDGSVLLALSSDAFDYWKDAADRGGAEHRVPAVGRAQAVAFKFDQGRVVVASESGAFQVPAGGAEDPDNTLGKGLAFKGAHNQQFVLNTLRWLGRVLP
ncbi:MAG: hypothetical protein ACSLFE_10280 [Gemmatimonadaceae bacterium]